MTPEQEAIRRHQAQESQRQSRDYIVNPGRPILPPAFRGHQK